MINEDSNNKQNNCMYADFEVDGSVWILLPTRADNWRDHAIPSQLTFFELIKKISNTKIVNVGFNKEIVLNPINGNNNIKFHRIDYDDAWVRDTGPVFVKNSNVTKGICWGFNAWGGESEGLYSDWSKDQLVAPRICYIEGIKCIKNDMILEGGSILSDGNGTLYTTESCLLNKNRNPHLNKESIERKLKDVLKIKKIIWLKEGLRYDETDGHIDNILMLVNRNHLLLSWTDNKYDPQYNVLHEVYEQLRNEENAMEEKLQITKITIPPLQRITRKESLGVKSIVGTYPRREGDPLICTYVNSYLDKTLVVIPKFGIEAYDNEAYMKIKSIFSDRMVIQQNAREIILGGGGIHCVTLGIPN